MFMSFDALNAIQETKFDTYEIVMPDPISGYALSVIKDKFPLGDGVAVEKFEPVQRAQPREGRAGLWRTLDEYACRHLSLLGERRAPH